MSRTKEQQELFKQGFKKCSRCKEEVSVDEFHKGDHAGLSTLCKKCVKIRGAKWRETKQGRFYEMVKRAHTTANQKSIPYNIDVEFLEYLWESQKGLCIYTGKEMTLESNFRNTVSLDRIVPSLGYVKDNVVLCCNIVNTMKLDMTHDELMIWCRRILSCDDAR